MTNKQEHHMLCLGVLADIYQDTAPDTVLSQDQRKVIEQAVASAEKLCMPVSVERLKRGLPISNDVL